MADADLDRDLRLFEETLGVTVCFHDLSGRLEGLVGAERIQHRTPFCALAKRHASGACTACDAWFCQREAAARGGAFWKRCHAGLIECFVPLYQEGTLVGAAFVGQWRWRGDHLPAHVACDPQPPRLPPRPPPVAVLDEPETLDRVLAFARCLGARIEVLLGQPPRREADLATTIRAWVANRVTGRIGLGDLAAHLGISASRCGHLVRERCGTTFPRLLLDARLAKARNLLALTRLDLAEIAQRCGFRDHRYFMRCFKKAVGRTPSAWRREQCGI